VSWLTDLPGIGMDFLSFLFMIFGQYSLVIGALAISIFTGWVWGVQAAGEEVRANDGKFPLGRTWAFLIRFVCPIAVTAILISLVRALFV
jgi:SNF family Na+-dependent transporter